MGLTNAYSVAAGRIPDLFKRIRDGQAPEQFTQQLLKDWGFRSSNDRALIPLLKGLGFLSPDGKPTQRYHQYRDHSKSKGVIAEALRDAYADLFLIKENPTESDKAAIRGKFKSFHNVSDNVANLMTSTFFALLPLADLSAEKADEQVSSTDRARVSGRAKKVEPDEKATEDRDERRLNVRPAGLHYNIQIHLPATKDVEVYNAIFKSLKEHLFDD